MAIDLLFAENCELEHIFERRVEICMERSDQVDDSSDIPISCQMHHLIIDLKHATLTVDTGSVDVIRLANANSSHVVG